MRARESFASLSVRGRLHWDLPLASRPAAAWPKIIVNEVIRIGATRVNWYFAALANRQPRVDLFWVDGAPRLESRSDLEVGMRPSVRQFETRQRALARWLYSGRLT